MDRPDEVLDRFAAAWNGRDAGAIAELFTDDADFVNVTGLWWHSPERIRAAHAFGFEAIFPAADMRFIKRKTRMLGPDAAVVHGMWSMSGQVTAAGARAEPRRGIFVFIMRRLGDGWKAVAAQNTDIVPGKDSIAVIDGRSVPQDYRS